MQFLIFDTETTGIPTRDCTNWSFARIVQIGWILVDEHNTVTKAVSYLISDDSYNTSEEAYNVHHISDDYRNENGTAFETVIDEFIHDADESMAIVCHSGVFDIGVLHNECVVRGIDMSQIYDLPLINTKKSIEYMKNKPTTLFTCVNLLDPSFVTNIAGNAHDALYDTYLCWHLWTLSEYVPQRAIHEIVTDIEKAKAGMMLLILT